MIYEPLAMRMRPQTIDGIAGQEHILNPNSLLYNMIKTDSLCSIILYGPPGSGKTTIASVIAKTTKAAFEKINAVAAGKKDIETACAKAAERLKSNERTILFVDEIHRFNKAQQDYLLPFVEEGIVILIGATTENPFFEVNNALMSRSILFELKAINKEDIKKLLLRALYDKEKGLGQYQKTITEEALDFIAIQSNGDVRQALSTLELAALNDLQKTEIDINDANAVIQKPSLRYDKDGDMHYDTISAFIKSMRGSDPDATLYYLARLLQAGEDPKFIARRIMIHASEDVGNADPMALVIATNASLAVERIGLPEGQIILAHAATYIALAPKSNSVVKGISKAMQYVHDNPSNEIPDHLKDAHYKSAAKLDHGLNYLYPHDYPNHYIQQQYLPDGINETFYESDHMGYQQATDKIQNFLKKPENMIK